MGNQHDRMLFALTTTDSFPLQVQNFKAKHVKTRNTRGQALRETYHIKDNSNNVLFKALECTDINVKPDGLLGYVYFEYRENRGCDLIIINIHDTFGNVVINTFRDGKILNMIYTSTGKCVGSFQERITQGTKGAVTRDLDLRLKACILFAAGLTARYCYYRHKSGHGAA